MNSVERMISRFAALLDGSAWMLVAPALIALYLIDASLARTFMQWSLFFFVLAGVACVISRIIFPHLDLGEFLVKAKDGNVAAAIVSAALILFVGLLIISGVSWVKGV